MGKFTILGASSIIGKEVVNLLTKSQHEVRPVSRTHGVPLEDQLRLNLAFEGADAAYVVIPFDMVALDMHQKENELAEYIAKAIVKSKIKRVVLLSGLNAHLKKGSSLGAALMEEKLLQLDIPELAIMRCGFFMENFVRGMDFLEQAPNGEFISSFCDDRRMPMIACSDISHTIFGLLTTNEFPDRKIMEMHGGGDYTFGEATKILGKALGFPETTYRMADGMETKRAMLSAGVSESFAEAVIVTAHSFNAHEPWALEPRTAENTSQTTLGQWASKCLTKT